MSPPKYINYPIIEYSIFKNHDRYAIVDNVLNIKEVLRALDFLNYKSYPCLQIIHNSNKNRSHAD